MEFSRQEYWSGFPLPTAGELPNPGIEPTALASPTIAGRFFTTTPPAWIGMGGYFPPIFLNSGFRCFENSIIEQITINIAAYKPGT